jgi:hypothetical protein
MMKKAFLFLVIVFLLSVQAHAYCVAQWRMNDVEDDPNVHDYARNHTGTFVDENGAAAVTSDHNTTGQIGGGLEFDGTNDYITALDSNEFTFIGTPFSVAAWVSLGANGASEFDIASKFETNQMEWSLYISGDALYFTLWDNVNGGNRGRIDTADYALYEEAGFIFVVGTYSGTGDVANIKVYLDGEQVDDANESNSTYSAMSNTTSSLYMGFRHGSEYKAVGVIDNVMVFDTELTQTQITLLYNDGIGTEKTDLRTSADAPTTWNWFYNLMKNMFEGDTFKPESRDF